jgi:hypothetical protein
MTRGLLPDDELNRIEAKLPSVESLAVKALQMDPNFMYLAFEPGSDIPLAAVCLQDATDVLRDARITLHECYTHGIYYRKYKDPPKEEAAIMMERFFLDDLALRLYATGEHLASAIIFMLELTDEDLKPYKADRASKQSIVGHYLAEERPNHRITKAVDKLASSKDWQLSMDYRGRWVHDQPPTVQGLGIVYRRCSKWERNAKTLKMSITLGVGDKPEYSIEEVRGFLEKGFVELINATQSCIDYFEGMLRDVGFTLTEDGNHWQLKFSSR